MSYFDENGRCIPNEKMRVFGVKPSNYYKIKKKSINYREIFERSKRFGVIEDEIDVEEFEEKAKKLLHMIGADPVFENLLKGAHVPFIYKEVNAEEDLGENLERNHLQRLRDSFCDKYPNSHFKAVLQSDSKLTGNITLEAGVGYEKFLDQAKIQPTIGWFFPQVFQEYDVRSQREMSKELTKLNGLDCCLSGGKDICAALIGSPDLLINSDSYAPIICMSSYVHSDSRLVLILKSYGPHMEFWCLTQMLTKNITQVSEQWTGGLTIFDSKQ
jgi:hypothetical protein